MGMLKKRSTQAEGTKLAGNSIKGNVILVLVADLTTDVGLVPELITGVTHVPQKPEGQWPVNHKLTSVLNFSYHVADYFCFISYRLFHVLILQIVRILIWRIWLLP